jgi:SecD/SecF fusion protein
LIEVPLQFRYDINEPTLRAEIEDTAKEMNIPLSYFDLSNPAWQGGSNAFNSWTLRIPATTDEVNRLLDRLQQRFAAAPVWSSSNKIGPQVAGRMQRTAIAALVASWVGIIIYVWVRFQNLVFGLAAVVALVHDVLVTVAALAVSRWLAGALGFLLIEDFKISITIVAALLTIVGYSINDTIVIFDRIREVRGKSPQITAQMINVSLNQTLSRTLLTSFTVLLVVVVLYGFGGEGIHGFSFALLVGTLSGTYSTIYIASPCLLWLAGKSADARVKAAA